MSTNHEKLFKLIAELTALDDPRIRINVNVGMQLTEWVNKTQPVPDTESIDYVFGYSAGLNAVKRRQSENGEKESHDLRNLVEKVPGAKVSGDISE